jgi:hypothetical protein
MEPSKKESFYGNLRFRFARGLAVCSAVISLLFLISCPSAFAGGQHGFSIRCSPPLTISFGPTPS